MIKTPDYLTFTRSGVTHLELEQALGRSLEEAYRQGARDEKRKRKAGVEDDRG